jgi:thiol-disulfide isomerase/thioredoxin
MKHVYRSFTTIMAWVLVAFSIGACDVIDAPFEEVPTVPVDTTSVKRVIVLEDFTGHTCGNCPKATDIAKQLETTYKDQLIVMAIHAGPFADPTAEYPADFRTTAGTAIDQSFRVSRIGNPNGMINRVKVNDKFVVGEDAWSFAVAQQLASKPKVKLSPNLTWNATNRTIGGTVDVTYLEDGTADYHFVAMLVENNVTSTQKDYRFNPDKIPNYTFNHMLRAGINGTWGEPLSTEAVSKNSMRSVPVQFSFPTDANWVAENCEVVMYIHQHNTTREILQAAKVKLVR